MSSPDPKKGEFVLAHPTHATYDEVPYEFRSFVRSYPDHLATIATLLSMKPQSAACCHVLELGCAIGGNLIPMALSLPNSQFLGVDFSARQIRDGKAIIEKLGLGNIELRHVDILDIDESYGLFDYILCHGVYSWVSPEVQEKILSICSRNLKPMGVAYVSYNVYPGWHMSGMIRDMMIYHAGRFSGIADRVAQARALLDFLSQSVPPQLSSYNAMLKESVDYLRKHSDIYLLHEYLEEHNFPLYFYQFMERAAGAELKFLSESDLAEMLLSRFPPEAQKTLRKISLDIIHMEQYMDFLGRRTFRQTLLCHQGIPINRNLEPTSLHGMLATANCRPTSVNPDHSTTNAEQFQSPKGSITLTDPYLKTALGMLIETAPMPIAFDDLLVAARERVGGTGVSKENDLQTLGIMILQSFCAGLVDLQLTPPAFTTTPSEKPTGYSIARLQADSSNMVTNARHEMVTLNEFDRQVLRTLDGKNNQNSIHKILMDLIAKGVLVARENDQPIQDQDRIRWVLERQFPASLDRLCKLALIVG